MQSLQVNHKNFNEAKLLKTSPETKTSKPAIDPKKPELGPQTQQYQIIPIQYEYDIPNESTGNIDKVVGGLSMELPEVYTPTGISVDESSSGCQIYSQYDITKPEIQQFSSENGPANRLYNTYFDRIFDIRGYIGFSAIQSKEGMKGIFKNPLLYFTYDKQTCQPIAGKNPTKYFQLISYGKEGSILRRETVFTLPIIDPATGKYQVVPWKMLKNVEMKYIPLVTFPHIYIGGGKCIIKCHVVSAVITYIVQSNSISRQLVTSENLSKDEILTKSIAQQFAALSVLVEGKKEEKKEETATHQITLPAPPITTQLPQQQQPQPLQGIVNKPSTLQNVLGNAPTLAGLPGLSGLTNIVPT